MVIPPILHISTEVLRNISLHRHTAGLLWYGTQLWEPMNTSGVWRREILWVCVIAKERFAWNHTHAGYSSTFLRCLTFFWWLDIWVVKWTSLLPSSLFPFTGYLVAGRCWSICSHRVSGRVWWGVACLGPHHDDQGDVITPGPWLEGRAGLFGQGVWLCPPITLQEETQVLPAATGQSVQRAGWTGFKFEREHKMQTHEKYDKVNTDAEHSQYM